MRPAAIAPSYPFSLSLFADPQAIPCSLLEAALCERFLKTSLTLCDFRPQSRTTPNAWPVDPSANLARGPSSRYFRARAWRRDIRQAAQYSQIAPSGDQSRRSVSCGGRRLPALSQQVVQPIRVHFRHGREKLGGVFVVRRGDEFRVLDAF